MTEDELEKNNCAFTMKDVYNWVHDYNCLEGRFRFFAIYNPHSELFHKVIRPLLSMRTTGSIDVERFAEP